MREAEFRDWLGRRSWNGRRLTDKAIRNRVGKGHRIERALPELGFQERDLDAVHTKGSWPQLLDALRGLWSDWRSNEAAARRMAPQAPDPTRQIGNLLNVARQYGHFSDGKDPNYDVDADADGAEEIDEDALAALKARFLAKFPDFEDGGAFAGMSSYHPEEDEYKRPLIAAVQARLAARPRPREVELGGWLLDQLLPEKSLNLVGDRRRKEHLRTVRDRSAGAFERAVGRLTLSPADPGDAAEAFTSEMWPLILEGSEQSKPYGDSRVLATLFQALARPLEAISIATRKFEHLAHALLHRKLFGWNPLTGDEYREALRLARRLFEEMEDWGWRPRDLWDVQGFIWVTCEEKLEVERGTDADRIRHHALDAYVAPARERGDHFVTIRAGDLHNALGMSAAHANVCQALRGRRFLELAGLGRPTVTGPENSSTTTFTYAIAPPTSAAIASVEGGPYWFVGASFGRTDDQFDRFIQGGFWEISEPSPRQREQVLSMLPGQRIAIKATYVRRLNLPFDNRGRPVSVLQIKAVGAITANAGDGERVTVAWQPAYAPREWYHYTYQPTIWEVYADKEMARRLIAFAFEGADQHYDWFLANLSNWQDLAALEEPEEESRPDPRRRDPQNIILFGPPGTGKTYSTMGEAVRLCLGLDLRDPLVEDPDRRDELREQYERLRALGQIAFVTFHQSFSYEDFIEGREPRPIKGSAGFELAARDGLFVKLARKAGESEEEHVLIVDEINRANVSKVFGELITLIERDKRKGMEHAVALRLPYSQDEFSVPANLHIVGTMNTADRSIALLDTALRRRFTFRELPPRPDLLPEEVDGVPLRRMLETMNDRIEFLVDRDHRIGHAFFMGEGGAGRAAVDRTMRDKVIPLLQEYFFEDWSRVAAVLGERPEKGGGFLDCRKLADPTGRSGEDRLSWSVRSSFAPDAYLRLVGRPTPAADEDAQTAEAAEAADDDA